MQDSSCRCPHLDAASLTEFGHGADPSDLYVMFAAQICQWLCHGRIGVFRQKYLLSAPGYHSFFQLFGTNHQISRGGTLPCAILRYFTIFFLIHTKTYYTHFSEKVNKKLEYFFVKMPFSSYRFLR